MQHFRGFVFVKLYSSLDLFALCGRGQLALSQLEATRLQIRDSRGPSSQDFFDLRIYFRIEYKTDRQLLYLIGLMSLYL